MPGAWTHTPWTRAWLGAAGWLRLVTWRLECAEGRRENLNQLRMHHWQSATAIAKPSLTLGSASHESEYGAPTGASREFDVGVCGGPAA